MMPAPCSSRQPPAYGDDLRDAIAKRALELARESFLRISAELNEAVGDLDKALAALEGRSISPAAPRLFSIADCARAEETTKAAISKRLGRLPNVVRSRRVKKRGQNFLPEELALRVVSPGAAVALARIAAEREASQLSSVAVAAVPSPAPTDQPIVSPQESSGLRGQDSAAHRQ